MVKILVIDDELNIRSPRYIPPIPPVVALIYSGSRRATVTGHREVTSRRLSVM